MKNLKTPNLVTVLIITVVTSFFWILFSVYRTFTLKPPPTVPEEISRPLTPTLDQKTIQDVQSKLFFSDSEIPQFVVSAPTPTPELQATPVPEETPIATESATPIPEETPIP